MQRQFDYAVFKLPGERLAFELGHRYQDQSTDVCLARARRPRDSRRDAGATLYDAWLDCVHFFDFVLQAGCNQVPLELTVCRQQSIVDRERLGVDVKSAYLFVVRQVRIDLVHGCLGLFPGGAPGHDQREISASVADQNRLLGGG